MKKFSVLLSLIAGFLLFFQTHQSHATLFPITGVETTVSLTSINDLIGLGLLPGTLGSATIIPDTNPPDIVFPITGGTLDDATGFALIEHDGSGFSLTKETNSSTFLNLENFLIDTELSQLFGDASTGGPSANIPIFDITPTLSLNLTETAAGAIEQIFGLVDVNLNGFPIGVASLNLKTGDPVPEPSTMALFAIGIVGLAGISIRRKKK
jgi:hypothetical protein